MTGFGAILLLVIPVLSVWVGLFWLMSRSVHPEVPRDRMADFVGAPRSPRHSGIAEPDFESVRAYLDQAA